MPQALYLFPALTSEAPFIIKHCASPTTPSLVFTEDASEVRVVGNTDCKQLAIAPPWPKIHLKQGLAPWASFVLSEPRIFERWCDLSDTGGKRDDVELCFLLKAFDGNRWRQLW